MTLSATIRPATPQDAAAVARIYNPYIAGTIITFEQQEVSADDMAARMRAIAQASLPYLVLEDAGRVIGYAYAGKWHTRAAYRHTVESTIYLEGSARGSGHGRRLYAALLDALRALPVHAVIGGISLPNESSVALHEKLGFAKVAHFPELGWKLGRWIDVGHWQLVLPIEDPA
jgi:phosphinothricin acetyltransferase